MAIMVSQESEVDLQSRLPLPCSFPISFRRHSLWVVASIVLGWAEQLKRLGYAHAVHSSLLLVLRASAVPLLLNPSTQQAACWGLRAPSTMPLTQPATLVLCKSSVLLRPWANAPAVRLDLVPHAGKSADAGHAVRALFLSPGDGRNLFTSLAQQQAGLEVLDAVLADLSPVILARVALLLLLFAELDPDDQNSMEMLYDVWFNSILSNPVFVFKLCTYIHKLIHGSVPWLSFANNKTKQEVVDIWRQWLVSSSHRAEHQSAIMLFMRQAELLPALYKRYQVPKDKQEQVGVGDTAEIQLDRAQAAVYQALAFGDAARVQEPVMKGVTKQGRLSLPDSCDYQQVLQVAATHWFTKGCLLPHNAPETVPNFTLTSGRDANWVCDWDIDSPINFCGPMSLADIQKEMCNIVADATGSPATCIARICLRRMTQLVAAFQENTQLLSDLPHAPGATHGKTQLLVQLQLQTDPLNVQVPHVPSGAQQQQALRQLPELQRFDIIDTGMLSDDVGLLPLLVAVGPMLRQSPHARLYTGMAKWAASAWTLQECVCQQAIGVDPGLYPTVLGLRLLTDLQAGRPQPLDAGARTIIPGSDPRHLVWAPATPCSPLPQLLLPEAALSRGAHASLKSWGPPGSIPAALQAIAARCFRRNAQHSPQAGDDSAMPCATPHTFAFLLAGCSQRMDMSHIIELAGFETAASSAGRVFWQQAPPASYTLHVLYASEMVFGNMVPPDLMWSFQAGMQIVRASYMAVFEGCEVDSVTGGSWDSGSSRSSDGSSDASGNPTLTHLLGDPALEEHSIVWGMVGYRGVIPCRQLQPEVNVRGLRMCLCPAKIRAAFEAAGLSIWDQIDHIRAWAMAENDVPEGLQMLDVFSVGVKEHQLVVSFLVPVDPLDIQHHFYATVVDVLAPSPSIICDIVPLHEFRVVTLDDVMPNTAALLLQQAAPAPIAQPASATSGGTAAAAATTVAPESTDRPVAADTAGVHDALSPKGLPSIHITGFSERDKAYVFRFGIMHTHSSGGSPAVMLADPAVTAAFKSLVTVAPPTTPQQYIKGCRAFGEPSFTVHVRPTGPQSSPVVFELPCPVPYGGVEEVLSIFPAGDEMHLVLRKVQAATAWPQDLPSLKTIKDTKPGTPSQSARTLAGLRLVPNITPLSKLQPFPDPQQDTIKLHCEAQFTLTQLADAHAGLVKGEVSTHIASGLQVKQLIHSWLVGLTAKGGGVVRRAVHDESGLQLLVQLHGPLLADDAGRPVLPITVYDHGLASLRYKQGAWKPGSFDTSMRKLMGKNCLGPAATSGFVVTMLTTAAYTQLKQLLYRNAMRSTPSTWQQAHLPQGPLDPSSSPFLASFMAPLYAEHLVDVKTPPAGYMCVTMCKPGAASQATRKQQLQRAVEDDIMATHRREREARIAYQMPVIAAAAAPAPAPAKVSKAPKAVAAAPANRKERKLAAKQAKREEQRKADEMSLEDQLLLMYGPGFGRPDGASPATEPTQAGEGGTASASEPDAVTSEPAQAGEPDAAGAGTPVYLGIEQEGDAGERVGEGQVRGGWESGGEENGEQQERAGVPTTPDAKTHSVYSTPHPDFAPDDEEQGSKQVSQATLFGSGSKQTSPTVRAPPTTPEDNDTDLDQHDATGVVGQQNMDEKRSTAAASTQASRIAQVARNAEQLMQARAAMKSLQQQQPGTFTNQAATAKAAPNIKTVTESFGRDVAIQEGKGLPVMLEEGEVFVTLSTTPAANPQCKLGAEPQAKIDDRWLLDLD